MTANPPVPGGKPEAIADRLFDWMSEHGRTHYDTSVTQLEHALQTAALALADRAEDAEVVAALLHDVGHFLVGEHVAKEGFLDADLRHEVIGADWLASFFPPSVSEPVRHHVPAKRYLCAVDPEYRAGLSDASARSLEVQGGPMDADERRAFEALAGWETAVTLRCRDDRAKVSGRQVPPLATYRDCVLRLLEEKAES